MLYQMHREKLLPLISPHPMEQQGSLCGHTFLNVTPSYQSKMTIDGSLDAEKLAEPVLLYLFHIPFSVPLTENIQKIYCWDKTMEFF